MIRILLVVLLFISCGSCGYVEPLIKPKAAVVSGRDLLRDKAALYESLIPHSENGFLPFEDVGCDSLLFSGLYGAFSAMHVKLESARWMNPVTQRIGWLRTDHHDCTPDLHNTRSTISRDMIIGLMWWAWEGHHLEYIAELLKDLASHAFILDGIGSPGELFMTPALVTTLQAMVDPVTAKFLEVPILTSEAPEWDFTDHLKVWHILLRGKINGGITHTELKFLQNLAEGDSGNPLYVGAYHLYMDGDMSAVESLLLNESLWPSDHLPTSQENYCAAWPIQRSVSHSPSDWEPCPDQNPRIHSGAELVVLVRLFHLF